MSAHSPRTMEEWYRTGPFKPYAKSVSVTRSTVPLTLIDISQPPGDFSDPPISELMIAISRRRTKGVIDIGHGRKQTHLMRGDFTACPGGVEAINIFEEPNAFLAMMLPMAMVTPLVAQAIGRDTRDMAFLQRYRDRDPVIQHLIEAVWQEAKADHPSGRLFVDGAMMGIIARLVSGAGRAPLRARRASKLDAAALQRTTDYVDATLNDGAGVAELAAQCGMTEFEFTRAFKAATGMAPYQFVIERRLERATHLLDQTSTPLADIAYTVGFASQSHMTDVFRAKLGVTPGRYRRERRS